MTAPAAPEPETVERHPASVLARPGCRDSAVYECIGCGATVCPDCRPSPGESDGICGDCYYTEDPEDEG